MLRSNVAVVAVVALLVGAGVGAAVGTLAPGAVLGSDDADDSNAGPTTGTASVAQFESQADATAYLQRARQSAGQGFAISPEVTFNSGEVRTFDATADGGQVRATVAQSAGGGGGDDRRQSSTNVQEDGVDEPDILKNRGEHVYYAPNGDERRMLFDDVVLRDQGRVEDPPEVPTSQTHVFNSSDPSAPERVANVSVSGKMLLVGDRLVVLQRDRLLGYDVSEPASPERTWTRQLNASVVTARAQHGSIYLVTERQIDPGTPCPIQPMGPGSTVRCTDIYHPTEPVHSDTTYTAFALAPEDGSVADSVSFVGSQWGTVVYASQNALYVTYTDRVGRTEFRLDYLLTEEDDRLPADVVERLETVRSYELSDAATRAEVDHTVEEWLSSLSESERDRQREALGEGYEEYLASHQRDLVSTGIVRIDVSSAGDRLAVGTVGSVPGTVNDQFSLDEHDGHLRVTTTVPATGSADSANDLYVLGAENLTTVGKTTGMGLTERVYSVRYVGDTAYVVTFRRIDPFHVVDLSNPSDPTVEGKLKLPGYSSYLHPVDENHVLGIGEEDGDVKAVLFDVSDPSDPTVADDYQFEAGWSAISESHHAFLQDPRHGVVFVPTGDEAAILNYTGGQLSLEKRVETESRAQRAMYVGDYMWIFGRESLTVLDERDWTVTTTREFAPTVEP